MRTIKVEGFWKVSPSGKYISMKYTVYMKGACEDTTWNEKMEITGYKLVQIIKKLFCERGY